MLSVRHGTVVLVGPARFSTVAPFAGGLESFVQTLGDGLRGRSHRIVTVAGVRPPSPSTEHRCDVAHSAAEAAADGEALRNAVADVLRRELVHVIHNNSSSPEVLDFVGAVPRFEMTLHTPPLPEVVRTLAATSAVSLSTPSHANATRWAEHLGRTPDVVHNGVDRTVFVPCAKDQPYLAWVGRIVPEKGLHLALKTAALLEMPLRIAGPIHDVRYFRREIEPFIGHGVSYEGHLGPPSLSRLLARATTTLVTPLWPEPFGLVVVESMASGTPVAAVGNGALGPGSAYPDDVVAVTPLADAAGLAGAVLRTLHVTATRCREASAPFDLRNVVSAYERRYGLGPPASDDAQPVTQ
jgi:glycosyltransferase involved in cell wall biosynthesis